MLVDLLGTGRKRRRGVGAGIETGTGTETGTESETETISGDTGLVLDHIPGLGKGIKGSPDIDPEAEVKVLPKTGRIGTNMGIGIWTDGGISMWTAPRLRSPPSGTFTMAKLPASCSLAALCSWRD